MTKPLASHKPTRMTIITATILGEPLGNCAAPPPFPDPLSPPPKGLPPRLGLRPNKEPRRLLKSRQTSSRSGGPSPLLRSEEHTSELQSLMRISYAVFCLKKKNTTNNSILI